MDIFKEVEKVLSNERPNIGLSRSRSYYPSAAMSVDLENPDKRIGACVRSEYYRVKKYSITNPNTAYSHYILSFGKTLEEWMIDKLKTAGVYVGSNEKFVYPGHQLISGEVDIIVKEPDGSYAVIENKT